MSNLEFANPWFLLLLLLIPAVVIYQLAFKNQTVSTLKMPNIQAFGATEGLFKYIEPFLKLLRWLTLAFLIIALARPRTVDVSTNIRSDEGVDIMMVVDVSLSMLARDLKPTRLAALQGVAEEFISERKADRMGIVVYSGEAITAVPLTTDKSVLIDAIRNLQTDQLEPGTAIGVGLATAINHLKDSKAKSKVVLLITDGGESKFNSSYNKVYIRPEDAAQLAKERDIKVHTIGIGTTGFILLPLGYEDRAQSEFQLDENLLKYIAQTANGVYFRATDNYKLEEIYQEINRLEKSEIDEVKYYTYNEYYRYFVGYALFFLMLEILLRTQVFRKLT